MTCKSSGSFGSPTRIFATKLRGTRKANSLERSNNGSIVARSSRSRSHNSIGSVMASASCCCHRSGALGGSNWPERGVTAIICALCRAQWVRLAFGSLILRLFRPARGASDRMARPVHPVGSRAYRAFRAYTVSRLQHSHRLGGGAKWAVSPLTNSNQA